MRSLVIDDEPATARYISNGLRERSGRNCAGAGGPQDAAESRAAANSGVDSRPNVERQNRNPTEIGINVFCAL
jgi:hypothetical protein